MTAVMGVAAGLHAGAVGATARIDAERPVHGSHRAADGDGRAEGGGLELIIHSTEPGTGFLKLNPPPPQWEMPAQLSGPLGKS